MSYGIFRNIKVDEKSNQIIIEVASNNVWPRTYQKFEIYKGEQLTIQDKLAMLFFSMANGSLQVGQINKSTAGFAYALSRYERNEDWHGRADKFDLVWKAKKSEPDAVREVYGDALDNFLADAMSDIDGKFVITKDGETYVHKVGRYDHERNGFSSLTQCFSKAYAKVFDYKTACLVASSFDWLNLKIEQI